MYINKLRRPRNKRGATIAEFAPGLALVIGLFLVIASISWYLTVQVVLKGTCEQAAKRISSCSTEEQATKIVEQTNEQFHSGLVGLVINRAYDGDGISLEYLPKTKAVPHAGNLFCHLVGRYHVQVLFCPWVIGITSDATAVLEQQEGFANAL